MATGTEPGRSYPQPITQPTHRGAPTPSPGTAVSPPSKRELASWWKKFRKTTEKDDEKVTQAPGIFGVPLAESIRYANVAISLTNEQGESFIYGYVPIVVAKCGVFLKEKATDVEGIFRLSGSAKRIKDLQTVFNSPERYGKGLDWTGYTVHDAANILRRYLNQLPEPIVPLDQYERFRDPLRALQQQLENHPEGQPPPEITAAEHSTAVLSYQKLITELPALNRQLLLYILDLLAVFSSKSDLNRMTAANLAAIFQPGIISHPDHDMAPQEYRLSQDVLIFLIENQDNFLIGMTGTAVDEKTQKDVESGAPSLKSPKSNIGRSASNASAGADSLRKYGIRRNVSTSSRASRDRTSPNVSSPGTPASPSYPTSGGSIGVARSNTVPSKRSPAIGQHRFQRVTDSSSNSPIATNPYTDVDQPTGTAPIEKDFATAGHQSVTIPTDQSRPQAAQEASPIGRAVGSVSASVDASAAEKGKAKPRQVEGTKVQQSNRKPEANASPFPEILDAAPSEVSQTNIVNYSTRGSAEATTLQVPKPQPTGSSPQTRNRNISNLFSRSPVFGPSDTQQGSAQKQHKKLQKRQRIPGTMSESAQSSAASLQDDPFHTPMISPNLSHPQTDPMAGANHAPTSAPLGAQLEQSLDPLTPPHAQDIQGRGSVTQKSPSASLRSGTSMTDPSDFDALDDPIMKADKKQNRWRFSSSAKRADDGPLAPPPPIGQISGARNSNSSIGSSGRPRQSFTAESSLGQQITTDSSGTGQPSTLAQSSHDSYEPMREAVPEAEKKGLLSKWKAKITQSKEERREREAEKERAKSPQRMTGDHTSSKHSLSAFAHDHLAARGRSFDRSAEDGAHPTNGPLKTDTIPGPVNVVQAPTSNPAPQTASVTAPTSMPVPATTSKAVSDALPASPEGSSIGNSGPAVTSNPMPTVPEESSTGLRTQTGDFPQPDSVQNTPTEIRGPLLGKP